MKILLLRGAVPSDRNPKEILWEMIERCEDLWTHLLFQLTDEYSEILYWGGKRKFKFLPIFTEKYVKDLKTYTPKFKPDVIIARGGFFKEYGPILKMFPDAVKIYTGAGKRYIPHDNIDYDIVLADSEKQYKVLKERLYNAQMWSKPAIDEIFYPYDVKKKYDVCYIANGSQKEIKNIPWVYKTAPKGLRMLHLGNECSLKAPSRTRRRRVLKKLMPAQISRCRIGIMPYRSIDSAPRALPEMLACGLPVVALNKLNFNRKTHKDVVVCKKSEFWWNVDNMLRNIKDYTPRDNYLNHLSMAKCVSHLRRLIQDAKQAKKI